jgi:Putative Actinobacterial Holin-X, holin superfamily III
MVSTTEVQNRSEPSAAALLNGILGDVQELVKQQLQLTRVEIKDDIHKTMEGAMTFASGTGVALVGAFLLGVMLVQLLYVLVAPANTDPSPLPLWGCYGIVGLVLLAGGGLLAYFGGHRIATLPLGEQTVEGLKENVEWKLNNKP